MARSRTLAPLVLLAFLVVAIATAFLAGSCGPSDLARALGPYESKLRLRLDDEARFWNQLADHAADQQDERGVAKYRVFLETKAVPYYVEMERALQEFAPAHERLARVHAAVLAYVRSKQQFLDLELKRLRLVGDDVGRIAAIENAEETDEDARAAYLEAVVDDFPDARMSTVISLRDEFLTDWYQPALAGKVEADAAVAFLRKKLLPKLRELRDGRFEDSPRGRLFRKWIVAADEHFGLLPDALPVLIGARRATVQIQEVQRDMERLQADYQRLLREAQRDK